MGRKSRRKAKLRAAARLAQSGAVQPVYQPKPIETPTAKSVAKSRPVAAQVKSAIMPVDVNRYQYIVPELQRIGIISGVLFLILIVLAFILH